MSECHEEKFKSDGMRAPSGREAILVRIRCFFLLTLLSMFREELGLWCFLLD